MFFRVLISAFAVCAIGWAISVLPFFFSEMAIARTADRVMLGDAFPLSTLDAVLQDGGGDAPKRLRSATLAKVAIIQLRIAELTVSKMGAARAGRALTVAKQSILDALKESPSESFLWLSLVWLDTNQSNQLRYLRQSYKYGPNEGWIAVRRIWFALKMFDQLPADLADCATAEFVDLIRSHQYSDAAEIIAGPGWPIRELLLKKTKDVDDVDRNVFAKFLREKGLDELVVPNTEPAWNRPWQRG
ncbi:hypothetical protein SAMN05444159_1698 [Bradyrhizobium lablabi]|uniref:Uncharacterized protein n=1 Tax=Bradyrhizobium lablabi TaxID=722472 RepID=A0A1M6MQC3_9BRAD|nr:hypothetical protein [Bradyrhizobium lablabi]SHJ85609.1 hypothetical protein SAMN05444159_1698 [Bradyrhizobium lablabi]